MNSQTITIALIILAALMVVGIITTLIMKKCKAHENAVTISILATSFCGLLAAGALVFLVTFNMMKDYMGIKRYKEYVIENDSKTVSLTVKEYANDQATGFELYLNGDDKMIADVNTDMFLPFGNKEYEVEWKDDSAVIYYTFQENDDDYRSKYCVVHFDGGFDMPVDSEKDLRPEEDRKHAFAASADK